MLLDKVYALLIHKLCVMVSALFVRKDSVYKGLGIDCWDADRNALLWPGGNPGIFHPPCRKWSRMRAFSTAPDDEKELAIWSVDQVRKWGGVLEHPAHSGLWAHCRLPLTGGIDKFGGFIMSVNLHWFGFPAEKKTYLYIVGCRIRDVPAYPLCFNAVTKVVANSHAKHKTGKTEIPKSMRDKTPIAMAHWLAEICGVVAKGSHYELNITSTII